PYFQVAGLNGPVFSAPAGAVSFAPLSLPAGAASGNCVAPGAALLAYGSALGAGVWGAGVWPCATIATMPTTAHRTDAISRFLTVTLRVMRCVRRENMHLRLPQSKGRSL